MSKFYQTPVLHCHWAGTHQEQPVIAITPDGREVQIPYEVASALLLEVPEPTNKFEGWDFKLKAGESVNMTATQIDTLQQATALDQVQQVVDDVLTANEESRVPGTTDEMPGLGEPQAPEAPSLPTSTLTNPPDSTAAGVQNAVPSQESQNPGTQTTGLDSSTSDAQPSITPATMDSMKTSSDTQSQESLGAAPSTDAG